MGLIRESSFAACNDAILVDNLTDFLVEFLGDILTPVDAFQFTSECRVKGSNLDFELYCQYGGGISPSILRGIHVGVGFTVIVVVAAIFENTETKKKKGLLDCRLDCG